MPNVVKTQDCHFMPILQNSRYEAFARARGAGLTAALEEGVITDAGPRAVLAAEYRQVSSNKSVA
jgi:hypothetical protein